MSNLVVQLWGIGNLVQTEPLLRALGSGDILVSRNRSTKALAPLFPKWRFIEITEGEPLQAPIREGWDDVYLCYPIDSRQFSAVANRIHVPTWCFKRWDKSEARVLYEMAARYEYDALDYIPQLKMPSPTPKRGHAIGLSIGYLKEAGWSQKHWGNENFARAVRELSGKGYVPYLFGSAEDGTVDGQEIMNLLRGGPPIGNPQFHVPLWEQIQILASCQGYLGNDTGLAHVAGALGIPTAVFTVTDFVKNRPAGRTHQFGRDTSPTAAVARLLEMINAQERA